ncbi:tyrosine-protein kinase Fer-like [Schistocerca americana]|uniref:tyrosine-protein kinase Fer-like n=1 Tax=Schistocerca americana TaxID=7009 RepID=UPI001F4FAD85|nr:tyrosine-protein kinase Fer-like [Schistocerca americana]
MRLCCCCSRNSDEVDKGSAIELRAGPEVEEIPLQSSNASHVEEDLQGKLWYHGRLTRELAEPLLCADGDFLVRESSVKNTPRLTLSVRWQRDVKHIILLRSHEGWYCRPGVFFSSVEQLVLGYQRSGELLLDGWGGHLLRPVQNVTCDLTSQDITLIKSIGEGYFGEVFLGLLRSSGEKVAVKMSKVDLPHERRRDIIDEGQLLQRYRHRHVVGFVGMCLYHSTIMVVMEFVPGGSLLQHLKEHRLTLSTGELTAMCRDAAEGMAYLEAMKCVHRDLAARNCLLGENNLVKISDFGMSREVEDYYMAHNLRQVPVRWTAPEALQMGKYSWMSDVWSFGVLMWEVFSRGANPYTGFSNQEVRDKVENGFRMRPPAGTPVAMATLMSRCWEAERRQRPHFSEILQAIEDFQARSGPLQ